MGNASSDRDGEWGVGGAGSQSPASSQPWDAPSPLRLGGTVPSSVDSLGPKRTLDSEREEKNPD